MSEDKDCDINSNDKLLDTKDVKCTKMREALIAIAEEVRLFHDSKNDDSSSNTNAGIDTFKKLLKSKSSLAFKRKVIRKLKEKVKTTCTVAQTAISAGENERTSLKDHLHLMRNKYEELYQKHRETSQTNETTAKDNQLLRGELENLYNFIELGYNELQKINECPTEISVAQQLKQIILSCGQYYADFQNEKEKNLQLNQKNRFLNNKINILNSSLDALSEDLKNLRRQNARLQKENVYQKERNEKVKPKYVVPIPSDCRNNYQLNYMNMTRTKIDFIRKAPELDVTVHLSIIKKLLRDQDDLLKDLKCLSKEISSD